MEERKSVLNHLDDLRQSAMAPNTLTRQTKELIALAVALRGGNDTSIAYHVHNCIEVGCSREQIAETVDVAVVVSGEAAAVHAVQVQKALAEAEIEPDDGFDATFDQFARRYG